MKHVNLQTNFVQYVLRITIIHPSYTHFPAYKTIGPSNAHNTHICIPSSLKSAIPRHLLWQRFSSLILRVIQIQPVWSIEITETSRQLISIPLTLVNVNLMERTGREKYCQKCFWFHNVKRVSWKCCKQSITSVHRETVTRFRVPSTYPFDSVQLSFLDKFIGKTFLVVIMK